MKTCIVIPARMNSTRLPGKPLADIAGIPMVIRVAHAARAAGFGEPLIAAGDAEIDRCAKDAGFRSVLTPADLPSGTDRVQVALEMAGLSQEIDCVVNLQGDLPNIDPAHIRQVVAVLEQVPAADIATLAALIPVKENPANMDVVKAVLSKISGDDISDESQLFRALYFSRSVVPSGVGPYFQHIGIYAYRRDALRRFTGMRPTPLEIRERLEQLRALENNMQIAVALVDQVPFGVDSPADLAAAQKWFADQT